MKAIPFSEVPAGGTMTQAVATACGILEETARVARKVGLEKDWITRSIEQALQALGAGRAWISIDERLPEEDGRVVVFTGKKVAIEVYEDERFYWNNDYDEWAEDNEVTHWMPLPSAPKEP